MVLVDERELVAATGRDVAIDAHVSDVDRIAIGEAELLPGDVPVDLAPQSVVVEVLHMLSSTL